MATWVDGPGRTAPHAVEMPSRGAMSEPAAPGAGPSHGSAPPARPGGGWATASATGLAATTTLEDIESEASVALMMPGGASSIGAHLRPRESASAFSPRTRERRLEKGTRVWVAGGVLLALMLVGAVLAMAWSPRHGGAAPGDWRRYNQTQQWYTSQLLDHFAAQGAPNHGRTWRQPYFEITTFAAGSQGGPVLLNVCGEYTCRGITDGRQYPVQVAAELGATVLSLGHRFYGGAPELPLTVANLGLLTIKQALQDLRGFISWYQARLDAKRTDGGQGNKWIILGGSYPGALAAWFRGTFPGTVKGAWASSAVVHAILDFSAYDRQVATSVGPQCAAVLRKITQLAEGNVLAVRSRLGTGPAASGLTDDDILYIVADVAASSVQYGHATAVCDAVMDVKNEADLLNAYLDYAISKYFKTPSDLGTYNRTQLAMPGVGGNMRSWWWQTCNEVGWFQVAAAPGQGIRSQRINQAYHMQLCQDLFGITQVPDVAAVNAEFGYEELNADGRLTAAMDPATNVVFTNGGQDPWQWASVRSSQARSLDAYLIDCDGCGHAVDLSTPKPSDAASVVSARAAVLSNIRLWLAA